MTSSGSSLSSGEDIPPPVLYNHHMLLGSISLCTRLKDLQQAHAHPKKKIPARQSGLSSDLDRVADDVDMNVTQVMEAGEQELLDVVREGMSVEVASRKALQEDAKSEGWSVADVFFSQVYSNRLLLYCV